MTNREAWRKGYEHGFKGHYPVADYTKVGLAGSYHEGYKAGAARRKEPKGGPKRNPGFLSHAIAKHKVKQARKRVQAEIARVQNRIAELEQEVIEYRHGPIWKGDSRAKQWAAQASLKVQKMRAIEKRLVKGLEELPVINPRRNGIIEAAAGLQALDYFGSKAKRAGLGKKPKFNPDQNLPTEDLVYPARYDIYVNGQYVESAGQKATFAARAVQQWRRISKKKDVVTWRISGRKTNPSDARFLLQIVTASGKREQFTTNTEKQAREIVANWYSRGASVTVIDRKKKTQTVYGKKNPSGWHPQRSDKPEVYNVYYRPGLSKDELWQLVGSVNARSVQDAINKWRRQAGKKAGKKIYGHVKAERLKNPRTKGSRDALGVWHAENPSLSRMTASQIEKALKRQEAHVRKLTDELVRQGRGNETFSETAKKDDNLSLAYVAGSREVTALKAELQRRLRYHGSTRATNPSVTDLSRTFQGEADGSVERLFAATGAPANLARAGKLVFLKVKGKTFRLPGAVVAIAPNEKLWITGKPPLFVTKARKGEGLDAGEVTHICYETAKAHIGGGKTYEYVHEFGEDGGKRPHLIIDSEGMPILRGGDYKIRAEGIVN